MKTHLGFIKTRLIEIERHSRIILRLFKDNSILNSKDIKIIQSNNLKRHAINFDCFFLFEKIFTNSNSTTAF